MKRFSAEDVDLRGLNLVEASAGTGKTYAITTLFLRLLLERGLEVDQILVVTFTEAAAMELRDRVRKRLAEALEETTEEGPQRTLEAAVRRFDEAAIFTIHGFCHRVLADSAFDSGALFDAQLVPDLTPLRDEVLHDFWTRETAAAPPELIWHLEEWKLDLRRCRGLVDRVVSAPQMPVFPRENEEDTQSGDHSVPSPKRFQRAFEALKRAWHRPTIQAMLLDKTRLKGSNYRSNVVPGWCDKLDESLAHSPPHPPRLPLEHKYLARFTPAELRRNSKLGTPQHAAFDAAAELLEAFDEYQSGMDDVVRRFIARLVRYAREQVPTRKEAARVLSFDDLLQNVERALKAPAGSALAERVRERYPAALIDEFQDTDPTQWAIFERVYQPSTAPARNDTPPTVFLIGDPKQAIYSFRGADVYAYLAAARSADESRRFTMDTNWRSDPGLVRAVSSFFDHIEAPFLIDDIEFPQVNARPEAVDELRDATGAVLPAVELLFVPRPQQAQRSKSGNITRGMWEAGIPRVVAKEIRELLSSDARIGERPVTAADIAVLTRSNIQAFQVQDALRRLGIPSVVLGDESVFDSREADELAQVLAAVNEPTVTRLLKAALTTELLGVTAEQLACLDDDERAWDAWVSDFREWNTLWAERGFLQMLRRLLESRQIQRKLLGLVDGERRLTNLLHLMELLHTAARGLHLGPAGLIQWLAVQRTHAEQRPDANQIRLESDEHAVKLTTIHKSKGLEYPIVYCPYLWDGQLQHPSEKELALFHNEEAGQRLELDLDRKREGFSERQAKMQLEALAEALRLLYVALTRARHRVTVLWGPVGSYSTSALGYLLHPPSGGALRPDVDTLKNTLKGLSEAELRAELARRAEASPRSIRVSDVDLLAQAEPLRLERDAELPLSARAPGKKIDGVYRIGSFSALTARREGDSELEGRDHDEQQLLLGQPPVVTADSPAIALLEFPRGPRSGNFLHAVLEDLDFLDLGDQLDELVGRKLREYRLGAEWQQSVSNALREVLAAQLGAPGAGVGASLHGMCLGNLPRERRLSELEFHFPALLEPDTEAPNISAPDLATVFLRHPSPELPSDYARLVATLGFVPLRGFLKGFIDLVFVHEGRWFVADYKSNHLGDTLAHYGRESVLHSMLEHHYVLQYHLYLLALHRYLGQRLKSYDYERHIGGAAYLFLRGMTPDLPGHSVFLERPPLERMLALDVLFRGRSAA